LKTVPYFNISMLSWFSELLREKSALKFLVNFSGSRFQE
jgi:hypothetical protein